MTSPIPVPFMDLARDQHELTEDYVEVLRRALQASRFIGGPELESFESEFAAYCQVEHCAGVGNGTDALRFALEAAGVEAGDSVVTVAHTFIATSEAISQVGALPEYVDVDARTYNLSPQRLREYLERQCHQQDGRLVSLRSGRPVTAIVPVHLYGQPAEMDPILELARRYHLIVVEDAAQAHGADYFSSVKGRWLRVGSMGAAAAFSFYPGKNLGACGEAGAVVSDDPSLIEKVRMLRDHGQSRKYHHETIGYNGRLDSIQAGFLRLKLPRMEHWTQQRRRLADRYNRLMNGLGGIGLPYQPEWTRPVHHLYVVAVDQPQEMAAQLERRGIGYGFHYPIPVHLQEAYRHLGYSPGDFPVSEKAASSVISLPLFPSMCDSEQERVVDAVREFAVSPARA